MTCPSPGRWSAATGSGGRGHPAPSESAPADPGGPASRLGVALDLEDLGCPPAAVMAELDLLGLAC